VVRRAASSARSWARRAFRGRALRHDADFYGPGMNHRDVRWRIERSKRTSWHERAPPKGRPITHTTICGEDMKNEGRGRDIVVRQRALNRTGSRPFGPRSPIASSEALRFNQGDDLYKLICGVDLNGDLISGRAGIVKTPPIPWVESITLSGGTVLDCPAHAAPASTVSFPVLRVL
jgi:hypothetical protein